LRDEALAEIRERGAELVIVGNGRPEHAADFRERQRIECPVLVDPELRAYKAAGLKRGVLNTIGPRTLRHGLRALRSGQFQGATQGDPWQQGGVFVIEPGNKVRFAYVSEEAGDHPDPADVVAALGDARGPGRGAKRGRARANR
jgi:hypothetical protein